MVLKVEDLDIYQMAEDLSDRVWEICIKWDYFAKDTIGKQLVRTADSISANSIDKPPRLGWMRIKKVLPLLGDHRSLI